MVVCPVTVTVAVSKLVLKHTFLLLWITSPTSSRIVWSQPSLVWRRAQCCKLSVVSPTGSSLCDRCLSVGRQSHARMNCPWSLPREGASRMWLELLMDHTSTSSLQRTTTKTTSTESPDTRLTCKVNNKSNSAPCFWQQIVIFLQGKINVMISSAF